MWTIFKVFVEFVIACVSCFGFSGFFCFFGHKACGILAPWPGIPCIGMWSLLTTGPTEKSLFWVLKCVMVFNLVKWELLSSLCSDRWKNGPDVILDNLWWSQDSSVNLSNSKSHNPTFCHQPFQRNRLQGTHSWCFKNHRPSPKLSSTCQTPHYFCNVSETGEKKFKYLLFSC